MGSDKCEKAHHWNIPVVSIRWLTDIVLGDLNALKLPVNSCYTVITGDENFNVDLNKVLHLLGMFSHLLVVVIMGLGVEMPEEMVLVLALTLKFLYTM